MQVISKQEKVFMKITKTNVFHYLENVYWQIMGKINGKFISKVTSLVQWVWWMGSSFLSLTKSKNMWIAQGSKKWIATGLAGGVLLAALRVN